MRSLEAAGVDTVFGIPGGTILPTYDPLMDSTQVRHILVRHEQGAGHAAAGYAYATGRVGVCMATSGPGATNLVTPIADAYMDSVPMVAITGQVTSAAIGTDAFQEADIRGITMPVTKHNYLITNPDDIPRAIAEAFHIAGTGRPGPGAGRHRQGRPAGADPLRLAVAAGPARLQADDPAARQAGPRGRPPHHRARASRCSTSAAAIIRAGASAELRTLAELTGIPVVTTLMARGAFPDSHPQHLGMPGMHGTVAAVGALQSADLLIALGTRFDDRVTGQLSTFAPKAKVIHADIDPAEISKNRRADLPIVGDAKEVITELIVGAAGRAGRGQGRSTSRAGGPSCRTGGSTYPLGYDIPDDGTLAPQYVIERLGQIAGPGHAATSPASASTRCGARSSSATRSRARGSTPAAWARWASRCPPRWAPRSARRTRPCGRSTATAASR